MGRLVPAHHPGDAGPRLPGGGTAPGIVAGPFGRKGGCPSLDERLIPLTVPEVRRLLYRLIWRHHPTDESVLRWSRWRRRHQATARRCHYRRRLKTPHHISATVVLRTLAWRMTRRPRPMKISESNIQPAGAVIQALLSLLLLYHFSQRLRGPKTLLTAFI